MAAEYMRFAARAPRFVVRAASRDARSAVRGPSHEPRYALRGSRSEPRAAMRGPRIVYACRGSNPQKEQSLERLSAVIGFVVILAIAFLLSNNRSAIRWRIVFWGLLLQILIAICVLKGEQIANLLSVIAPAKIGRAHV